MSTIQSTQLKVPYGPYCEPYSQALIFAFVSILLEAGQRGLASAVADPSCGPACQVFGNANVAFWKGMRLSIAAHITGMMWDQIWLLPSEALSNCSSRCESQNKGEEVKKSKSAKRKAHDVHGILESCAQAAAAVATPVPGKTFSPSKPLNDTPRLKQSKLAFC